MDEFSSILQQIKTINVYICNKLNQMKRKITKFQAICFTLLWVVLCFLVLTSVKVIDGPVILSLVLSAALVFIPIVKTFNNKRN